MKNFFSYEQLKNEGLIKGTGKMLDLGCGDGKYSVPFKEAGWGITLIDKAVVREDIQNIDIQYFTPSEKYDVIFMRNVLPFVNDHLKIDEIIQRMQEALNPEGVLVFTLFGTDDPWYGKRNEMTFVTSTFFEWTCRPNIPYATNEYKGMGSTMNGDKKFWHIFTGVIQKVV